MASSYIKNTVLSAGFIYVWLSRGLPQLQFPRWPGRLLGRVFGGGPPRAFAGEPRFAGTPGSAAAAAAAEERRRRDELRGRQVGAATLVSWVHAVEVLKVGLPVLKPEA